jgi:hypothetical protein
MRSEAEETRFNLKFLLISALEKARLVLQSLILYTALLREGMDVISAFTMTSD